jgi:hypothetical protein
MEGVHPSRAFEVRPYPFVTIRALCPADLAKAGTWASGTGMAGTLRAAVG